MKGFEPGLFIGDPISKKLQHPHDLVCLFARFARFYVQCYQLCVCVCVCFHVRFIERL